MRTIRRVTLERPTAAAAPRNVSGGGRPLLCQRGYYVASRFISCGSLRSKETSTLVWRGDMISSAELDRCMASNGWARISDEKYHQSCYGFSPHQRRPVNE